MLVELGVLVLSIFFLAKAAEQVIENAVILSRYFRINQLAVGFLLVSVATSLPELSIAVNSAIAGEGAISAGDVFGSNIANILIILGIGSFLYGMKISGKAVKQVGIILLITTLISVYIIFSSSLFSRAMNFYEGLVLIILFCIYAIWTLRNRDSPYAHPKLSVPKGKAVHSFLLFALGIVIVIIASGFVVDSTIALSVELGIAESFIGSTLIAIGTSMPELGTTLAAVRKKYYGLVIGNIVGSNMTNLTLVLGINSVINPIFLNIPVFMAALLFAVISNFILFYLAAVNKGIGRYGGLIMLATYLLFIISISALQGGATGMIDLGGQNLP